MIRFFKHHQGFTLIETLISIALIGVVIICIIGLFTICIYNNNISKGLIENAVLARDIMDSIKNEFSLIYSDNIDLHHLRNKALEIQNNYENVAIKISPKDNYNDLYIIEIDIKDFPGERIENFASQIYLP